MNNWNLLLIGGTFLLSVFFLLVSKFKNRWQGTDQNKHGGFDEDTIIGLIYSLAAFVYFILFLIGKTPYGNLVFAISVVLTILFAWNVAQFFVYLKSNKKDLRVIALEVLELVLSGIPVFIILWILTGLAF